MQGPIDTGGYFYPVYMDEDNPNRKVISRGVTLRDWFAGMAVSGLVAEGQDKNAMHPKTALEVARTAYHIADLMIRISREAAEEPEVPMAAGAR